MTLKISFNDLDSLRSLFWNNLNDVPVKCNKLEVSTFTSWKVIQTSSNDKEETDLMPLMVGNPRNGVQQPKLAKFIKSSQPCRTPNLIWNYQNCLWKWHMTAKNSKKLLMIPIQNAYNWSDISITVLEILCFLLEYEEVIWLNVELKILQSRVQKSMIKEKYKERNKWIEKYSSLKSWVKNYVQTSSGGVCINTINEIFLSIITYQLNKGNWILALV